MVKLHQFPIGSYGSLNVDVKWTNQFDNYIANSLLNPLSSFYSNEKTAPQKIKFQCSNHTHALSLYKNGTR